MLASAPTNTAGLVLSLFSLRRRMHGVRTGEVIDDEPSVVVDLGAFAVLHKARVLRRAVGLGVDEQERVLRVGGQVVLALQPVGGVVSSSDCSVHTSNFPFVSSVMALPFQNVA